MLKHMYFKHHITIKWCPICRIIVETIPFLKQCCKRFSMPVHKPDLYKNQNRNENKKDKKQSLHSFQVLRIFQKSYIHMGIHPVMQQGYLGKNQNSPKWARKHKINAVGPVYNKIYPVHNKTSKWMKEQIPLSLNLSLPKCAPPP